MYNSMHPPHIPDVEEDARFDDNNNVVPFVQRETLPAEEVKCITPTDSLKTRFWPGVDSKIMRSRFLRGPHEQTVQPGSRVMLLTGGPGVLHNIGIVAKAFYNAVLVEFFHYEEWNTKVIRVSTKQVMVLEHGVRIVVDRSGVFRAIPDSFQVCMSKPLNQDDYSHGKF